MKIYIKYATLTICALTTVNANAYYTNPTGYSITTFAKSDAALGAPNLSGTAFYNVYKAGVETAGTGSLSTVGDSANTGTALAAYGSASADGGGYSSQSTANADIRTASVAVSGSGNGTNTDVWHSTSTGVNTAQLSDTAYFYVAGATASTTTTIGIDLTVQGSEFSLGMGASTHTRADFAMRDSS